DVPAAAMAGDADAVRRLLDLGFAVDATDAQGCTGLLRGAGGGHAAVVDLLLSRGANPQHAAHSGATPLSAAVSMRQAGIVGALLDAGADLEHRLPGGVTVLMLASALGLADIAARLLTAGANIAAGDGQGLAPLHCAALYGFTGRDRPRLLALLDTLLLAGAEPDQPAAGGVTPLLLLLGARAEPGSACDEAVALAGLERLLAEDVLLDAPDPRGFGPLPLPAPPGPGRPRPRRPGPARHAQPHPARDRDHARLHRRGRRVRPRAPERRPVDGPFPARTAQLSRASWRRPGAVTRPMPAQGVAPVRTLRKGAA